MCELRDIKIMLKLIYSVTSSVSFTLTKLLHRFPFPIFTVNFIAHLLVHYFFKVRHKLQLVFFTLKIVCFFFMKISVDFKKTFINIKC